MIYADAAFLVSLCLADVNSPKAVATMTRQATPITITSIPKHERRNALRRSVWRTRHDPSPVTVAEATGALARSDARIPAGEFIEHPLSWSQTMNEAERIGALHTMTRGVRGMDLLNVAAAVAIGAKTFLTFDPRQRAVAKAGGLIVGP
jgi:predicted nucleic acid-binding protein